MLHSGVRGGRGRCMKNHFMSTLVMSCQVELYLSRDFYILENSITSRICLVEKSVERFFVPPDTGIDL